MEVVMEVEAVEEEPIVEVMEAVLADTPRLSTETLAVSS